MPGSTKDYCGTGCRPGFGKCDAAAQQPQNPPPAPIYTQNPPAPPPYKPTTTSTNKNAPNSAGPTSTSAPATTSGSCYNIPDLPGTFAHHALYTFDTPTLPAGLTISNNPPIHDPSAPFSHRMSSANVALHPPYIHLTVPGGQTTSPIQCAEISTSISDIKYASVRTMALFSSEPGVCHGLFFYRSDTQETDIEYLTSPHSTSNPGNGSLPLHFTNQPANGVHDDHSYAPCEAPEDVMGTEHEYRIDWVEGLNVFYVDGREVQRFEGPNVPRDPGSWVWNNWADGGVGWSVGPPGRDAVLKIRKVEMWYNREGDAGGC